MKRAIRRAHVKRLRKNRKYYYTRPGNQYYQNSEKRIASYVDTPTPCSCHMCGNPRRYFKEVTFQEKRFLCNPLDFE